MDLNIYRLDNTLVASKWRYIAAWFDAILDHHANAGSMVVVTDRSPLDTVAYIATEDQCALALLVRRTFSELEANKGLLFRHILLTADADTLIRRVRSRLIAQPQRSKYHENETTHHQHEHKFYRQQRWHACVDSTNQTPDQVAQDIMDIVATLRRDLSHD